MMGREEPSNPLAPQSIRKDQRAKHAKATINKVIPAILKADVKARKGIENAELIIDPPPLENNKKTRPSESVTDGGIEIRLEVADTLLAAHRLHNKRGSVAILNMASPLRPGGGVLNGATSQEESLCVRTTLLPSLKEEWYRLPEVGGIWSPDVCVFRLPGHGHDEDRELGKCDRFHVGVVTAAMLRFPDLTEDENSDDQMYANESDRELVNRKMRVVVRILSSKGVERVVLGAWGYGAYGNPMNEVVKAWKRVLLGLPKKSKGKGSDEGWGKLKELVFAIKDATTADRFAKAWGPDLQISQDGDFTKGGDEINEKVDELKAKIEGLESQMSQTKFRMVKERLATIVIELKEQLAEREAEVEEKLQEAEEDSDTAG